MLEDIGGDHMVFIGRKHNANVLKVDEFLKGSYELFDYTHWRGEQVQSRHVCHAPDLKTDYHPLAFANFAGLLVLMLIGFALALIHLVLCECPQSRGKQARQRRQHRELDDFVTTSSAKSRRSSC